MNGEVLNTPELQPYTVHLLEAQNFFRQWSLTWKFSPACTARPFATLIRK